MNEHDQARAALRAGLPRWRVDRGVFDMPGFARDFAAAVQAA